MTDDIEERAALARRGVMDHSDCEELPADWWVRINRRYR